MTKSVTSRALVLSCVVVFAILLGCGGDKDAPVYDTVANPYGLPIQACDLIDGIEAGRLVSYDVITEAFGRLYLENQELLENKHWKEIIARLGGVFHRRADELIKNGIQSYSQAAGFYMLASFSNPDDAELAGTAALFTTWKEMMEKIDYNYIPLPTSKELADRLDFLRCFVLGDSLEQAFADQFLVHQLLDSIVAVPGMAHRGTLSRSDADLLLYLGVLEDPAERPLKELKKPPVDLWAYRVVAIGEQKVRAELYFTATEAISDDWRVAIAIDSVGDDSSIQTLSARQYIHFEPQQPTSSWLPGQMQLASVELAFGYETVWLEFTLSRESRVNNDSVTFEIVDPPLKPKQPLTVERFSQR